MTTPTATDAVLGNKAANTPDITQAAVLGGFDQALENFVNKLQALINEECKNHYSIPTISTELGKKYVRIVKNDTSTQRNVHCFVDKTNGDILKAASWKTPAKKVRGNIYRSNPLEGVTIYGAARLK